LTWLVKFGEKPGKGKFLFSNHPHRHAHPRSHGKTIYEDDEEKDSPSLP
jgi:hypothetical protein